jgi:hypothetical protein
MYEPLIFERVDLEWFIHITPNVGGQDTFQLGLVLSTLRFTAGSSLINAENWVLK